jgi:hypothetical protein
VHRRLLLTTFADDCNALSIQINSSTEATALAQQCPLDFQGIIRFGESISGNISFNGLQTCGVLASNGTDVPTPNLTGVASNSLYWIGFLELESSPALQTLSFPNLTKADILHLMELPLLTEFEFGAGLTLPLLTIINGTGLKFLRASLPSDPQNGNASTFIIMQNKDMSQIHLGVTADIAELSISDNAPGAIIDLPNLRFLNHTWLSDFSTLNIPKLQVVNSSLNISNAQVFRFSAPSLQYVGGNFTLTGNFLEYVLISKLRTITADNRLL